ncbi:MAG: hypothetical protein KAG56_02980 [Sulfurovaceae bacterium]|nr:hypothetical protein [Sulfurovaceae bacterium]
MKKMIFGAMTLLALVAFSSNSYAEVTVTADNNSSAKCGEGKCSSDKSMKCGGDKPMKCGAGKCGGGK